MSDQPHLVPSTPRGGVEASALPSTGFGSAAPSWWGTIAFMVIEGTSVIVCIGAYLYLRRNFDGYPPHGFAPPGLLIPTINLALMLVSIVPAMRMHAAAHEKNASRLTRAAVMLLAMELVIMGLRVLELDALNVRWDSNAYGSAAWFTVGFHTMLLLVDFAESLGIALIFITGKAEPKHFTDAADDAIYWYFVVAMWVLVYGVIFVGPRVL